MFKGGCLSGFKHWGPTLRLVSCSFLPKDVERIEQLTTLNVSPNVHAPAWLTIQKPPKGCDLPKQDILYTSHLAGVFKPFDYNQGNVDS